METSMPNSALQQAQASEAYACVVWSAFALAIYDYVVTLPSEAKVAWRRPFTATTALFLTTRWTMVAIVVTNAAPIAHVGHCVAVVWVSQVLSSVSFVQAAVFSALRIFALWRSNYVLAFLVLAPGLVPAVLNLYTTAFHSASAFVLCSGGAKTSMLPHAELIILLHVSRSCLLAMDSLVLVLTWLQTFRQLRSARELDVRLSLSRCLLRDGTLYFFLMLAMNVADILTFNTIASPMASLAQILPSVLMNHFIINLRTLPPSGADARPDPTWLRPRTLSTMSFPMPPFLGNIGEELVHGDAPDPEDGSEELLMQDLDSLTDDSVSSAGTAASPRREPEDIELRYV